MEFKGYDESCIGFRTAQSRGGPDFWPRVNGVVDQRATATRHPGRCPREAGDGVCVAFTARGAQSGGACLGAHPYLLLVGWHAEDELARSADKVRVSRAKVLARLPLVDLLTSGADLTGADLRGADLRWANLAGADLAGADLRWADLRWANLAGADLAGADLRWADLAGADLRGADLRGADLAGAYLRGADLRGADLAGAYLRGADLRWATR